MRRTRAQSVTRPERPRTLRTRRWALEYGTGFCAERPGSSDRASDGVRGVGFSYRYLGHARRRRHHRPYRSADVHRELRRAGPVHDYRRAARHLYRDRLPRGIPDGYGARRRGHGRYAGHAERPARGPDAHLAAGDRLDANDLLPRELQHVAGVGQRREHADVHRSGTAAGQSDPEPDARHRDQPAATSGNGAAAGAIPFPNIRGGLSFETASLIDGHPVSVGAFGDYVSTFLNAFTLGSVEVVKGPGANAPEVNYAIGGTVNFRTLDPSRKPTGYEMISTDSFGGVSSNFGYSNTIMNGKLGFVFDYGVNGSPGPLTNYAAPTPMNRNWFVNGQAITGTITTSPPIPGTTQTIFNGTATLLYSGIPVSTTYIANKAELVKLRCSSPRDRADGQLSRQPDWTEQNGNHFNQYTSIFNPAASARRRRPGRSPAILAEDNIFAPPHEWEMHK